MILDIEQTEKGLYDAKLIIQHQQHVTGGIQVAGNVGLMEAKGMVILSDTRFSMQYIGGLNKQVKLPGMTESVLRPYSFCGDIPDGVVYCQEHRNGLFSSYSCTHIRFGDETWDMYPIGFGAEGLKNPIYHGKTQIGQIEKDAAVTNDLHHFRVFIKDAQSAAGMVALCAYMFISVYYKPGQKAVLGVQKSFAKTTAKVLKEKYDPGFCGQVEW